METIETIRPMGFYRLRNDEYSFFSNATVVNIRKIGSETLAIPPAIFEAYCADEALVADILSESRISSLTAMIGQAETRCKGLLRHLLGLFDSGRSLPDEADRKAYVSLYNLTKPYRGMTELPQHQLASNLSGLLLDLTKEEFAALIDRLGLTGLIGILRKEYADYAERIDERRKERSERKLPACRVVRVRMDKCYTLMMSYIVAAAINDPSAERSAFISAQNALIAEVKSRHNLRISLLRHYRKSAGSETDAAPPSAGTEREPLPAE